jgi:hypothetical protein
MKEKTTKIDLTEPEVHSLLYLLLKDRPDPQMTEYALIHKLVASLKDFVPVGVPE